MRSAMLGHGLQSDAPASSHRRLTLLLFSLGPMHHRILSLRLLFAVFFVGILLSPVCLLGDGNALVFGNESAKNTAKKSADDGKLTLDRIYRSSEFSSRSAGGNWLPASAGEQAAYTELKRGSKGGQDIVRVDAKTGQTEVLVAAEHLIPAQASDPLSIQAYQWSKDFNKVLIFTKSVRVWRQNTRGDYWVFDRSRGQLTQIGQQHPASSLMYAKFSPTGKSVGYVFDGNLYLQDLDSGSTKQLTQRESDEVLYGMSDWVYEEEFTLRDGFRFSPDGKRIAYWRFDTSQVGRFTMINNTDSLYPKNKVFAYPKAGTTNSDVRVLVQNIKSGNVQEIEFSGDPRENYLPRIHWIDSTGELLVRRMNRDQNEESFYLVNFDSETKRLIYVDKDDRWIDLRDQLLFSSNAESLYVLSDRTGWRQLTHVNIASGQSKVESIGKNEFDIVDWIYPTELQSDARTFYVIASPENATERYLYVIDSVTGKARRVTPSEDVGSHRYQISPDGKYAIHQFSNVDTPTVTEVISLPNHRTIRVLEDNAALKQAIKKLDPVNTKFIQVDLGDVKLNAWMMTPGDLDPEKKYPLLVHVYGEPAGSTVVNRWGGSSAMWHRMLAQQGYIVVSIDNRGTDTPRGNAFRKSVYKLLATLGPNDQAAAAKQLLKDYPFIDAKRVGMWGWSGGGTSTLHAMFRYPDLYSCGVSIAPVANLAYYDTIYEERYMSTPAKNVDGYRTGSAIHFVEGFKGKLLLIHGTADDNVHYQATELLINELIAQDKQFEMLIYPGRSHSISERANTRPHLMKAVTDYFHQHLPVGQ